MIDLIKRHFPSLIILYAISLHYVWAFSLFSNPAAANTTAIHTLVSIIPPLAAAFIYFAVASLATIGLFYPPSIKKIFLCLPQQFIMLVSAGGALKAMWLGQFADGVQRANEFLISDQAPAVLGAFWHTVALIVIIRTFKNVRNY